MYLDRDTTVDTWFRMDYPGDHSSVGRALAPHARGWGYKSLLCQGFLHMEIAEWVVCVLLVSSGVSHGDG